MVDENKQKTASAQEDRLIDHHYDGIQEYDNPIPLWLNLILVGSVIFSLVYIPYYHYGPGQLPHEVYEEDIAAVEAIRDEQRKEAAVVDGDVLVKDATVVAAGAEIYGTTCAACHGANAEGGIGPNLKDDQWRNGTGSFAEIQTIIAEGIGAKGMPAWETTLGVAKVQQVATYVYSIAGSEPGAETVDAGAATAPVDAVETTDSGAEAVADGGAAPDGAQLFATNCASCHKADGTGLVGPNLTDAEWVNGDGSLASIAKVIAEGSLAKGMPAWQAIIGDDGVAAVAEYVAGMSK